MVPTLVKQVIAQVASKYDQLTCVVKIGQSFIDIEQVADVQEPTALQQALTITDDTTHRMQSQSNHVTPVDGEFFFELYARYSSKWCY